MQRILIASLFVFSGALGAAEDKLDLDSLDQRLKIAERKLELAAEAAGTAKAADAAVSAGPGGFTISSADKNYSIKFGALLQEDARVYVDDLKNPLVNSILLRRARISNQTVLGPSLKLNIVLELATPAVVDAYADFKLASWANLRVGRFKTPISLENFRSDPTRDFVETGFTLGLATVRDNGAWLELADADQAISLAGGVFDGGLDGATVTGDTNDDKEAVGKLFLHPTRLLDEVFLRDFGFGVAASSGHRSPGSATTTYSSTGQNVITSYKAGTTVQDQSFRIAPQAYLYQGSFSLLSEYIRSTDFATNTGNTTPEDKVAILSREAWQVQGGWVLTGEDASFGGLKWNKETTGDWGVWQLVGRYQEFQVDGSNVHRQGRDGATVGAALQKFVDPRVSVTKAQGWGIGLNWIPTANAKVYFDFEQNSFTDGAFWGPQAVPTLATATNTANRETENTFFVRTQIAY